jgi:hypothetical protein
LLANDSRDEALARFARIAVFATGIGTAVIGGGGLLLNLFLAQIFDYRTRLHPTDSPWETYAGHSPFPIPWWFFAIGAFACLAVVILCWNPRRWPGASERSKPSIVGGFPLPAQVGFVAGVVAGASEVGGQFYPPLGVASLYGIPLFLGVSIILVCLVWYRKVAPPDEVIEKLRAKRPVEQNPIQKATLAAVHGVAIVAGLLGVVLVFVQVVALWLTNETPVQTDVYQPGSNAYRGVMPFLTPPWVFLVLNGILVVFAIVARDRKNWPRRWDSFASRGEPPLPVAIGVVALSVGIAAIANAAFAAHDVIAVYVASAVISAGIYAALHFASYVTARRALTELQAKRKGGKLKTPPKSLGKT